MNFKTALFSILAFATFNGATSFADEPAVAKTDGQFKNESEAGVVLSTGNTQVQAFNLKQTNSYEWSSNIVKFNGRYLGSTTKGTENARYFTLGLRYERLLVEKFSLFAAETFESDIFTGYNHRYSTDVGVKYILVKSEETNWFVEAGYRYIAEQLISSANNDRSNSRIYSEVVHNFAKNLSAKLWAEYIQSLANGKDLLFNSEISMAMALNETFSVKLGYLLRYNNNPLAPAQNTDTTFTTSLVAKF